MKAWAFKAVYRAAGASGQGKLPLHLPAFPGDRAGCGRLVYYDAFAANSERHTLDPLALYGRIKGPAIGEAIGDTRDGRPTPCQRHRTRWFR